jgi:uncharacterized protein YjdB/uncharacterized protein YkwD
MVASLSGNLTYVAKAADDSEVQSVESTEAAEAPEITEVNETTEAPGTTENPKVETTEEKENSNGAEADPGEKVKTSELTGTIGNLSWKLVDGVLTITGSGSMTDFSDTAVPGWNDFRADITSVVVENGVTNIGRRAFNGCTGLTEVSLPESVKEIGAEAFYGCTSLTTVTLSEGLTDIYRNAFANCSALANITIPKSVEHVWSHAFGDNTKVNCLNTKLDAYGSNGYRELEAISVTGTKKYDSAYQVLEAVNEERAEAGVEALKMNSELMKAAMVRSSELSVLYAHTRPDGSYYADMSSVVRAENYSCRPLSESASVVVEKWMESKGSNMSNILNSNFNVVGVGCVEISGRNYWTLWFGRDDSADDCAQLNNVTESQTVMLATEAFAKASDTSGSSADETAAYAYELTLDVPSSDLKIGSSIDAAVYVTNPTYKDSQTKIDAGAIIWSSSDANVASVANNGKITIKNSGTTVITASTKEGYYKATYTLTVPEEVPDVNVIYCTHIQNKGWEKDWNLNGAMSGTSGQGLRLEGIEIYTTGNSNLGIQYTTHCQDYGWLPWSADGDMSGTEGEAKRLEAIKIQLTGTDKDKYDVYYRVHAQNYGWLNWARNGAASGTAGLGYRLEAIQIVIVKKGESFNTTAGNIKSDREAAYIVTQNNSTKPEVAGASTTNVVYRTHVQNVGWQGWKYNGAFSGTSGKGLRLEGINLKLTNKQYSGGITYRTHIQNIGWETTWKSDGVMSGTSGRALRLEAIQIQLTGEMANHYDVYYRVHAQNLGWLSWTKNGASSGTAGYGYRLEGIQVVLVEKGGSAPSATYGGVTSTNAQSFVQKQ